MYLHWSKKIVLALLGVFGILMLLVPAIGLGETSTLKIHTVVWILLNYAGVSIWVFIWIGDQLRMRGKPVWPWFVPMLLAPLPTLTIFLLHTLRQTQR